MFTPLEAEPAAVRARANDRAARVGARTGPPRKKPSRPPTGQPSPMWTTPDGARGLMTEAVDRYLSPHANCAASGFTGFTAALQQEPGRDGSQRTPTAVPELRHPPLPARRQDASKFLLSCLPHRHLLVLCLVLSAGPTLFPRGQLIIRRQ